LATVRGPKLYTNLGNGQFRDDSSILPAEACYDLTGAAWIDADGDGKLDLLLANGFHGLKLCKNNMPDDPAARSAPPRVSQWHYIGPFDNTAKKGVAGVFPPEKDQDLKKQHGGRNGAVTWKPGNFTDGVPNSLTLFPPPFNNDSVIYLHREIETATPLE